MELRILLSLIIVAGVVLALRALSLRQRRRVNAGAAQASHTGSVRLLYVRGDRCAQCRVQAGYLAQLPAEVQAAITTIDAAQAPEEAQAYGVLSLPTTIILDRSGQVRHINNGLVSLAVIAQQLSEAESDRTPSSVR